MPGTLPDQLLDKLWFYVAFDCNLSCRYCVADAGPASRRPRIEIDTFRQLVDEASSIGFRQILISGGEPLLHPDILPMLQYSAARIDTVLLTNATLAGTPNFQGLGDLSGRRLSIQVSLDGAEPFFHDRWRGKGSWKRTVDGLSLLLQWGFDLSVRATLTEQSDAEIEQFYQFLEGCGIARDKSYVARVAVGGRSQSGLQLEHPDLLPEVTLAADGLYTHPLKVDQSLAVTRTILPLLPALEQMAEATAVPTPAGVPRRYR